MITRTHRYAVARGFTVDENTHEPIMCEHVLDGYYKSKTAVQNAVRRELNKNFVLIDFTAYKQACTMSDEVFYAHCDMGEAIPFTEAEDTTTPVVGSEENNNNNNN